jgi:hypothetical protein
MTKEKRLSHFLFKNSSEVQRMAERKEHDDVANSSTKNQIELIRQRVLTNQ